MSLNSVPVMHSSVGCLGNDLFGQVTEIDDAAFIPIRLPWHFRLGDMARKIIALNKLLVRDPLDSVVVHK